jgi:hypothetical protein
MHRAMILALAGAALMLQGLALAQVAPDRPAQAGPSLGTPDQQQQANDAMNTPSGRAGRDEPGAHAPLQGGSPSQTGSASPPGGPEDRDRPPGSSDPTTGRRP